MPVLRVNAAATGLSVHNSPACADAALRRAAAGTGPMMVLVHGYKYQPGHPQHCPHRRLLATGAGWPAGLGFGRGDPVEGLALAFGWPARGRLAEALRQTQEAGALLSRAIRQLKHAAPDRTLHLMTHSMGSEVAFAALHHLRPGDVQRVLTITGASYASRAHAALDSPAGRRAELLNIISGENDVFDALYTCLVPPPAARDRVLGAGIDAPNTVNIQIDCPKTLAVLAGFAGPIRPPGRRVCHWSGYTRPGLLAFYAAAMRRPDGVPLPALRAALPAARTARFSRLFAPPSAPRPLRAALRQAS
ncbi:MAG: alpha/beta hydrolase [Pseudomonadota bacterium]